MLQENTFQGEILPKRDGDSIVRFYLKGMAMPIVADDLPKR